MSYQLLNEVNDVAIAIETMLTESGYSSWDRLIVRMDEVMDEMLAESTASSEMKAEFQFRKQHGGGMTRDQERVANRLSGGSGDGGDGGDGTTRDQERVASKRGGGGTNPRKGQGIKLISMDGKKMMGNGVLLQQTPEGWLILHKETGKKITLNTDYFKKVYFSQKIGDNNGSAVFGWFPRPEFNPQTSHIVNKG